MDTGEQPYDDRHGPRPKAVLRSDVQSAIEYLERAIDQIRGFGDEGVRDAASVVLFALRQRIEDEQAPVPMPRADEQYTLDKAIVDTERAVRLNHLGHYTGMVAMVLGALQDRMDDDLKQNVPVDVDPPGPVPGTPLDTQTGLRYISPGGKFAAYWGGKGEGPYFAQISLLDLRILAAHLTTAIDHVTGELELRRH